MPLFSRNQLFYIFSDCLRKYRMLTSWKCPGQTRIIFWLFFVGTPFFFVLGKKKQFKRSFLPKKLTSGKLIFLRKTNRIFMGKKIFWAGIFGLKCWKGRFFRKKVKNNHSWMPLFSRNQLFYIFSDNHGKN